ncbi:hypothetical protein AWM79_13955 [Pseudomonas agarici]|uniref:Uncharacterized protein n=1 Tax=Pseudomonas agarici TaxID=46677 RepID=A0A0X1T2M6_PSEAA|nr:hypothetical protein AWM79_13955 [Pseudomonas agarici]
MLPAFSRHALFAAQTLLSALASLSGGCHKPIYVCPISMSFLIVVVEPFFIITHMICQIAYLNPRLFLLPCKLVQKGSSFDIIRRGSGPYTYIFVGQQNNTFMSLCLLHGQTAEGQSDVKGRFIEGCWHGISTSWKFEAEMYPSV